MSEYIRIKIIDYYPTAVGEEEYVAVSKSVFELLENTFRKEEHARYMQDIRNRVRYHLQDGVSEEHLVNVSESAEEEAIKNLDIQQLKSAMDELTEVQKERLYLYFFEGLSTREIAIKCGSNQNAVWKSIQNALKKIKKFFS